MARVRRFPDHRFVGLRDDMVVYDCDDTDDLAALEARLVEDDLMRKGLVSTFGPDTIAEARNRGFSPR